MRKDHSWMYGSIKSLEFVDRVLEFCSIAVEHQVRTGELDFIPHVSSVAMHQR